MNARILESSSGKTTISPPTTDLKLMEVVGPHALIAAGSEGAALYGDLEHEHRRAMINTFGGGVVEVLRGLVATHGLGMPQHR